MDEILGYDCDGYEIYEFMILRAIWSNDIDINLLEDSDPRQYCAIIGEDGNAYAISVYDWWYKELIRKRENIPDDEEIPVIVKPISAMQNYECAVDCNKRFLYYDLDKNKLKKQLEGILNKEVKRLKKEIQK